VGLKRCERDVSGRVNQERGTRHVQRKTEFTQATSLAARSPNLSWTCPAHTISSVPRARRAINYISGFLLKVGECGTVHRRARILTRVVMKSGRSNFVNAYCIWGRIVARTNVEGPGIHENTRAVNEKRRHRSERTGQSVRFLSGNE